MKKKLKILKYTRPVWYNYLRVQRSYGISWRAAISVAVLSFLFLFGNGFLTDAVANKAGFVETFIKSACVLTIAPFYRKIEVYSRGIGMIILILMGALGYALATQIF